MKYSLLIVAFGVMASAMTAGPMASASGSQIPVGGPKANVTGKFGPVVAWPIIPIHAVLLPGGRVMSYGTDSTGQSHFPGFKLRRHGLHAEPSAKSRDSASTH